MTIISVEKNEKINQWRSVLYISYSDNVPDT